MERYSTKYSPQIHILLMIFVLIIIVFSSCLSPAISRPGFSGSMPTGMGSICGIVNCGQGRCVTAPESLLGVECVCNPGWRKLELGDFLLGSCIIPNCTADFRCGLSPSASPLFPLDQPSSPPVARPPRPPPSNLNLSNPCGFVWCGDGNCTRSKNEGGLGSSSSSASSYTCQCNNGSTNLFLSKTQACFKPCNLGFGCHGFNFPFGSPQLSFPPPSSSSSLWPFSFSAPPPPLPTTNTTATSSDAAVSSIRQNMVLLGIVCAVAVTATTLLFD